MKKLFSILTFLLVMTTVYSQKSILVFKPDVCVTSEVDTTYEYDTQNIVNFGFDFQGKTLYFTDVETGDWKEVITTDTVVTKWTHQYHTINFDTETAHWELWVFPSDNSTIPRPQQLFEFPLVGLVSARQYYVLTPQERK